MSKISAKNAVILVDGYNLSTYFTNYDAQESVNPVDVTGFGDGSNNFIPSLHTGSITGNAMWDNTAATSYPVMKALQGGTTDHYVTIIPEGAAGTHSLSMNFTSGGITPGGSPTSAITLGNLSFASFGSSDDGLEQGQCVWHGTDTNSTTGTGYSDSQAAGDITCRCSGTLHIWQVCSDTYSIKIQSSSDDITYSDLVTFTLNGSALGAERVAVASGTVKQYRRVLTARTGAVGDALGYSIHFWREPTVTT